MKNNILLFLALLLFAQCVENHQNTTAETMYADSSAAITATQPAAQPTPISRPDIKYVLTPMRDSGLAKLKNYDSQQRHIVLALNRIDMAHVTKKDTLIVPENISTDINEYSPFPSELPAVKDVRKIIFFSYPAQAFGAYENGRLVRWGPTNMGRKKDPTPTGLFYANWKAEETKSTFNDEWELKWNVNIDNKEGIGWHQYAMPGYPASHSCLRLLENDAKYLFDWVDEWKTRGKDNVIAQGTPVIVFGSYPFGHRKPWLALAENSKALGISSETLTTEVQPHLQNILTQQKKRPANSTAKK